MAHLPPQSASCVGLLGLSSAFFGPLRRRFFFFGSRQVWTGSGRVLAAEDGAAGLLWLQDRGRGLQPPTHELGRLDLGADFYPFLSWVGRLPLKSATAKRGEVGSLILASLLEEVDKVRTSCGKGRHNRPVGTGKCDNLNLLFQ